jgi:hypothetical protein
MHRRTFRLRLTTDPLVGRNSEGRVTSRAAFAQCAFVGGPRRSHVKNGTRVNGGWYTSFVKCTT